jgi:hypothetical protein
MNYEDEPYVRLYTRKTLTWKLLGWEGRVVRNAMLDGEFDAAGIFEFRGDPAVSISAVTELPVEIVRIGLQRLVDTETWIVTARVITWPNYEEAQNCRRSDRLRQRESRRARSAQSVTGVTLRSDIGHSPSQQVTASHPPSLCLPPSAPSLPSTQERDPERAPDLPEVPGLERVSPLLQPVGGSGRVYSLPGADPPKEFLDDALMGGVSIEQAKSTWEHYHGAGLPPSGVERLHPWLVKRAKERAMQLAKAPKSGPRMVESDLDTTGAATAFRPSSDHEKFCAVHRLDLSHAVRLYRASPEHAKVGFVESERRFMTRLKCWLATGTFIADGPLPRPPARLKEARA